MTEETAVTPKTGKASRDVGLLPRIGMGVGLACFGLGLGAALTADKAGAIFMAVGGLLVGLCLWPFSPKT